MCLKLIFHNLICDVRPKVARGIHSSPIINPYADPKPCAPDCAGKERIPPYFRCLKHKCCMNSATYVDTSCRSRCSPAEITLYHVYSQWGGATPETTHTDTSSLVPEEQQWEALPAIDSYIPKLRVAIPMSPAFRVWRAELLTKGGQVQEVLDLMDMVETRLAEELHHQQNDHRICVELERNWERLRRYETEQRPAVCRNGEKITRFWEKLGKLGDLLKTLERRAVVNGGSEGYGPSDGCVSLLDDPDDDDDSDEEEEELTESPDLSNAAKATARLFCMMTRVDLFGVSMGVSLVSLTKALVTKRTIMPRDFPIRTYGYGLLTITSLNRHRRRRGRGSHEAEIDQAVYHLTLCHPKHYAPGAGRKGHRS
ncbi:hypothetical protein V8F33_012516 [Rhypophila sp. PSN 637]